MFYHCKVDNLKEFFILSYVPRYLCKLVMLTEALSDLSELRLWHCQLKALDVKVNGQKFWHLGSPISDCNFWIKMTLFICIMSGRVKRHVPWFIVIMCWWSLKKAHILQGNLCFELKGQSRSQTVGLKAHGLTSLLLHNTLHEGSRRWPEVLRNIARVSTRTKLYDYWQ